MSGEPLKLFCRKCHSKYDVSDMPPFSQFPCPECGTVLRTPQRFGKYLLEKICARGGMSTIYRAIDPEKQARVAVKIADISGEFSEMQQRFSREIELMSNVVHSSVLQVYDAGVIGEQAFIVMEFMDGGDLELHMKRKNLPPLPELTAHLRQVSCGLQYLFLNHGIVHHDVKPSNIMLNSEGNVKIGDFDLADIRTKGNITNPCPLWGSPGYLSPERLMYGGEDHRGDIYSLGITIYELFSGLTPFGIKGETEELIERRKNPFTPLVELCPEAGEKISSLVDRMLCFDVEMRPPYPEIIRTLQL